MLIMRAFQITLLIYVVAAVLPAFILLRYIYRNDTVEREPMGLLVKLLVMGVLSALCAGVVEGLAEPLLGMLVPRGSLLYTILLAFVVVAAVEEGAKFFFLKRSTWRDPNFNYRFDGIVYAVFVSLGFAAFENIRYVFAYGLSTALVRAITAIPGHMSFAVFMGLFYGRAKVCESIGRPNRAGWNNWRGYLTAVLIHGFYDACAMIGTPVAMVIFVVFVVVLFLRVFRLVKQEAAMDSPVY